MSADNSCVIAVSFRMPAMHPQRWYSDRDLALLWNFSPSTVSVYRYRARRLGYAPHPDQYRVHKVNAWRRHAIIRADYAAILEALLPQLGTYRQKI